MFFIKSISKIRLALQTLGGIVIAGSIVVPSFFAAKLNIDLQNKPKEIVKEVEVEVEKVVKEMNQEIYDSNEKLKKELQAKDEDLNTLQHLLSEASNVLKDKPKTIIKNVEVKILKVTKEKWNTKLDESNEEKKEELQDKEKDLKKREDDADKLIKELERKEKLIFSRQYAIEERKRKFYSDGFGTQKNLTWKRIKDFIHEYITFDWGDYGLYLCAWEHSYTCSPFRKHSNGEAKTLKDLHRELS